MVRKPPSDIILFHKQIFIKEKIMSYTYVVIDDEELIRKGTIKKLSPMADTVVCIGEADNGKAGVELIAEKQPDFAILDMQMPVMDGMELLPFLAEHYPSMPLIVISGYKDFDYIKQAISANAIEYLVKPFSSETLQKTVSQAIDQIAQKTSIQNRIRSTEEEKEQARYDYDITLLRNLIRGIRVQDAVITSRRLNYINDTHDFVLLTLYYPDAFPDDDIEEWLEDHGFGDLALYLSEPADQEHESSIILFFAQRNAVSRNALEEQILESLSQWFYTAHVVHEIGVSGLHQTLSELAAAYSETADAMDTRLLEGNTRNIYYYESRSEQRTLNWPRSEEFLFRIEAGMHQEVADLSEDLFRYFHSVPGCRLADAKQYAYDLSEQCRQILNSYMRYSSRTTGAGGMQNIISHIFNEEELCRYFSQFFLNITDLLREGSVYAIDDVIEKVQIYMQRNYRKNITQDFIASLFYLNRSYLSTLFKSRTGEKFIDYLNDIRIEHAKEMLEETPQKIDQIAVAVGYDNIKYFFRVFKKKTGTTPEKYRNNVHHS